jgi:SSS family solute:Na+ symporter
VLCISLGVNGTLAVLLGLLGFALLSFFQNRPETLAVGQSIIDTPDQLLPQYIIVGLPPGLSGLVIAALVAAAMSSLSSGVNSASSVIASDLVARLRATPLTGQGELRVAKAASWVVGVIAIALSLGTRYAQGNLLELCFKIANLLTIPLFMLFFMAMFVPWATTLGVWAAGVSSAIVAVGIGYYGWLDLGFLWITIGPLIAGVVVGPLVSLLPIGKGPGSRIGDLLQENKPGKDRTS